MPDDQRRPVITYGPDERPLEKLMSAFRRRHGEGPPLEMLTRANDLCTEDRWRDLAAARDWARRDVAISPDDLESLSELVDQVAEESFASAYVLASLLQATAVARCALDQRNVFSGQMGMSARRVNEADAARAAYADAVEGLRIRPRLLECDPIVLQQAESKLQWGWGEIKQARKVEGDILDLNPTCAAAQIVEHIVWNSDQGPGNGLLTQSDATVRLAVRLQHLFEIQDCSAELLAGQARDLIRTITPPRPHGTHELFRARCAVTLADAFLETGQFEAAVPVYEDVVAYLSDQGIHPLTIHAQCNQATCLGRLGRLGEARGVLADVDWHTVESIADHVLTLAAETARFATVAYFVQLQDCPYQTPDAVRERIGKSLEQLGVIVSPSPADRTEHLRAMFVFQLDREVTAILPPQT